MLVLMLVLMVVLMVVLMAVLMVVLMLMLVLMLCLNISHWVGRQGRWFQGLHAEQMRHQHRHWSELLMILMMMPMMRVEEVAVRVVVVGLRCLHHRGLSQTTLKCFHWHPYNHIWVNQIVIKPSQAKPNQTK
jgi:uncharacterized membrane protein YfhO